MPRARARVRRWGSSLGIIVPSEIAKRLHLKAGDEIVIEIDKADIKEAFGSLKHWTVDPQKLKDKIRSG
ncbi:MAG: AbrB/MazE/SpoVT family DNA-binding domain-containing protein [Thermoplasmata archaeon]|nr:AbrB/MazE/SpoVT family DNA-binding domain-containing protein [Thermoplasmata archaeon]